MFLLKSALFAAATFGAVEEHTLQAPEAALQRGRIEWFEGSWDELEERAAAQNRIVFVKFWTSWCVWCRKLDKKTLRDPRVVGELEDVICYSIDAESEEGQRLARRFYVHNYPTLVFLDPDGETRDVLPDYHAPDEFLKELRRVKRNEGTLGRLRDRIRLAPKDLEARYRLALKLEHLGDELGYDEQIEAILLFDPDGESIITRHILLSRILAEAKQNLKLQPLYAFIEKESSAELLFPAWQAAWDYEYYHLEHARSDEDRVRHQARWLKASRALWQHAPDRQRPKVGNNIAWYIYEHRAQVSDTDLAFALEVARKAASMVPRDPYVIDTLACCLFAVGRTEEALETVKRTIELDPANPQWRKRLQEFRSPGKDS